MTSHLRDFDAISEAYNAILLKMKVEINAPKDLGFRLSLIEFD